MDRNYKNTFCGILILAILLMAVGYSILSTRLNVEGTSKITSDFNIQVISINEIMTDGLAETTSVDYAATSASYSTNLQAPGDIAVYEIIVENKGNQHGYVNPKSYRMWYDAYVDYDIMLGVVAASRNKISFSDYDDFNSKIFDEEISEDDLTGKFLLAPGEKLYYYAVSMFDIDATSLPENKSFSNSINFTFKHVDENGTVPNLVLTHIEDAILEDNPVVTSGNGVMKYPFDDEYYYYQTDYASTGNTLVNNYIKISNKLWRIVKFNNEDIFVVEDEETINPKEIFSNVSDNNGYYNNIFLSPLNDRYWGFAYVRDIWTYEASDYHYIENTKLYTAPITDSGYRYLLSINELFFTTTSPSCTFANLSSGGCRSWLTDNGNTYLANPVMASDEVTNTGNIAYLKDDKVIAVDPRDEAYGEYKVYARVNNSCGHEYYINNSNNADGTRNNPYILDTDTIDEFEAC